MERWSLFFEFYGKNSFAGQHLDTEEQTLTLIDVAPFNKGILEPLDFIREFGHFDIPPVLFIGQVTEEFIDSVKDSSLKDMFFEGVVCKGANDKKTKMPIMFKIKSKAWLDKVKNYCNGNAELLEKLI